MGTSIYPGRNQVMTQGDDMGESTVLGLLGLAVHCALCTLTSSTDCEQLLLLHYCEKGLKQNSSTEGI